MQNRPKTQSRCQISVCEANAICGRFRRALRINLSDLPSASAKGLGNGLWWAMCVSTLRPTIYHMYSVESSNKRRVDTNDELLHEWKSRVSRTILTIATSTKMCPGAMMLSRPQSNRFSCGRKASGRVGGGRFIVNVRGGIHFSRRPKADGDTYIWWDDDGRRCVD